mgnify:CR=1 FL=1
MNSKQAAPTRSDDLPVRNAKALTPAQAAEFVELYANCENSYADCCIKIGAMPVDVQAQFRRKGFREQFKESCVLRGLGFADQAQYNAGLAAATQSSAQARGIEVLVKNRQWSAERLAPEIFGTKSQVEHTHQVDIAAALQAAADRVRRLHKERDITPSAADDLLGELPR